jgi:hypothetical protein
MELLATIILLIAVLPSGGALRDYYDIWYEEFMKADKKDSLIDKNDKVVKQ